MNADAHPGTFDAVGGQADRRQQDIAFYREQRDRFAAVVGALLADDEPAALVIHVVAKRLRDKLSADDYARWVRLWNDDYARRLRASANRPERDHKPAPVVPIAPPTTADIEAWNQHVAYVLSRQPDKVRRRATQRARSRAASGPL